MKISLRKLSRLCGYSPATVSNALSGRRAVSGKAAETILRIAREQGYLDGDAEEIHGPVRLVLFKSWLAHKDTAPFFAALVSGIEHACEQAGRDLNVVVLSPESAAFARRVAELLEEERGGAIVVATDCSEAVLRKFGRSRSPLVFVDNRPGVSVGAKGSSRLSGGIRPDISLHDAVMIDNLGGISQAVHSLVELGHRRIGYVRADYTYGNFEERLLGWRMALLQQNLPVRAEDVMLVEALQVDSMPADANPADAAIVDETPTDPKMADMKPSAALKTADMKPSGALRADGCATLAGRLRQIRAGGGEPGGQASFPTALVCDNDGIAVRTLAVLQQFGLATPADVSVVGFDDTPVCELTSPPLATLRVSADDLGRRAMRQLLEQMKAKEAAAADPKGESAAPLLPVKVLVPAEFVLRASVRELLAADERT